MEEAWVLWIALVFVATAPDGLALRTSSGKTRALQLRLMTKAGESEVLPRRGPAIRENEIAAIFRGVAYGAPTQGRPNVTTLVPMTALTGTAGTPFPSTSASGQGSSEKRFTSALPFSQEQYHFRNEQNKPINHSSLVAKDVHEIQGGVPRNTNSGNSRGYSNNDVLVVSTHFPLATSHTAYDTSSSEKTIFNEVNGPRGKGVWISGFPNSLDVRWTLGIAWWVHVYVSVGLFTLLALLSLCLMARVAIATPLLPRPNYLALHILIFCSSFVRSLHILQESHGMKYIFPITLLMAVEEFGWPCLTAALAVLLVAVLREWRYPKHPQLAHMLYLFTGLHLIAMPTAHMSLIWLKQDNIPMQVIVRSISTGWGGTIGIGGMWAVWRESRECSSHLTEVQGNDNQGNYPSVTNPARLVLTAALTQLLLAGLHLYTLLVPVSLESHAWIWWSCVTVSRGLELIIGSTLLTAAALTLARPSPCHVFGSCCHKRTVEIVHPAEIKMIHPMGVYTLQPARPKNEHAQTIAALSLSNSYKEKRDHSSLDYVTSDFQLVWNHSRQRPMSVTQSNQQIVTDDKVLKVCTEKGFNELSNAHLPLKSRGIVEPYIGSGFSSTLPRNRMYGASPTCLPLQEDLKSSNEGGINYASRSSTLLSGSSGSSKLYSSPQIPLRPSRSWDEISTGHIYEDLMKVKPGSVDEGLSDLSDMNSDNMNDLFFSEAGSPVLIRSARKEEKRTYAACYVRANYLKHQSSFPSSAVISKQRELNIPRQNSTQLSINRKNSTQQSTTQHNSTQQSTNRQISTHNTTTHQIATQQLTNRQISTHNTTTRQISTHNDYCQDKIPPPTNPHILELPVAHNSSTQQVALHTPSNRTNPMNMLSGSSKSWAK